MFEQDTQEHLIKGFKGTIRKHILFPTSFSTTSYSPLNLANLDSYRPLMEIWWSCIWCIKKNSKDVLYFFHRVYQFSKAIYQVLKIVRRKTSWLRKVLQQSKGFPFCDKESYFRALVCFDILDSAIRGAPYSFGLLSSGWLLYCCDQKTTLGNQRSQKNLKRFLRVQSSLGLILWGDRHSHKNLKRLLRVQSCLGLKLWGDRCSHKKPDAIPQSPLRTSISNVCSCLFGFYVKEA